MATKIDRPAPPAVAYLREHRPTEAEGFAAILDALDAPPPAFLADVPTPARLVGVTENTHLFSLLHLAWSRESSAEAADRVAGSLAALRALLASEVAVRFLAEADEEPVPTWRQARPRLGFHPAAPTAPALSAVANAGEVVYVCGLTDRLFALPAGASVPCLFFDYLDGDQDPRADNAHPEDRNPSYLDVHPAIAVAGPAVVLAALWGDLRSRINEIATDLDALASLATLAAGVTPDDVTGAEVLARALVTHEADGCGGFREVPAGWRDLGRSK